MSKRNGQKPLLKPLADDITIVTVGGRSFELHEMKIGHARKFALKLVQALDNLRHSLGPDKKDMDIEQMLMSVGDELFETVTELWNFIFEHQVEGYKPVTQEWLENAVSIRELVDILKEVARLSKLDSLLPFFQTGAFGRMAASPLGQTSTQPITS